MAVPAVVVVGTPAAAEVESMDDTADADPRGAIRAATSRSGVCPIRK
jgi:hypothetical protein